MKLISQADVVRRWAHAWTFGTLPQYGLDYWPKKAKIIQIDTDAKMLGLVKPISVGINGDEGGGGCTVLAVPARHSLASKTRPSAIEDQGENRWESELDKWTHETDYSVEISKGSSYMHPRQMLRELERAMPKHAMVSTDIGNICSVSNSYLRFEQPRSMLAAMSFGTIALCVSRRMRRESGGARSPGNRLRRRRRVGYQSERAIDLRAREDRCQRGAVQQRSVGCREKEPCRLLFAALSVSSSRTPGSRWRSPSAAGILVDKLSDVGPALQQSVKNQTEGRTTVLELMVTKELGDPFRRDALSKPIRHLANTEILCLRRRL